jgi:hypothetical protein
VRIWEHTLTELTGGRQPLGDPDGEIAPQLIVDQSVVPITHVPGYGTAMIKGIGDFANQALVQFKDGGWQFVGSYVDDTILIDPSARGKGLAEELLLRCAEHRHNLPLTSNFSNRGYALLRRTHRRAVERALKAGLYIPENVREEFEKG